METEALLVAICYRKTIVASFSSENCLIEKWLNEKHNERFTVSNLFLWERVCESSESLSFGTFNSGNTFIVSDSVLVSRSNTQFRSVIARAH
jgi:hypothetical protein